MMKKIISILSVVSLLVAMLALPSSAADRLNVMTKVIDDTTIVGGIKSVGYVVEHASRIPANMFDGLVDYHENVAGSYAGFKTSVKVAEINDGTAPRYNVMGETGKDDSIYLGVLYFELNKIYTVDSLAIYSSQFAAPELAMDGFDILVSTTGQAGSWVKVDSLSDASCGVKGGTKWEENVSTTPNYPNNVKHTATFAPTEAKFVAFGLTQPRCNHTDLLKENTGRDITAYQHYFRIAEFQLFEADPNAVVTTKAPETTKVPETTAAPVTTAPAQTPATADSAVILVACLVMSAAVVVALGQRRLFN